MAIFASDPDCYDELLNLTMQSTISNTNSEGTRLRICIMEVSVLQKLGL